MPSVGTSKGASSANVVDARSSPVAAKAEHVVASDVFPASLSAEQRSWCADATSRIAHTAVEEFQRTRKAGKVAFAASVALDDEHKVINTERGDVGCRGHTREALDKIHSEGQKVLDQDLLNLFQINPGTFRLRVLVDLDELTFAIRVVPSEAHKALAAAIGHIYIVLAQQTGLPLALVGSTRYPIELQGRETQSKEADWGLAFRATGKKAFPSFAFEGGFSETYPQLLKGVKTWMKLASTLAVLIAYYSPTHASLNDEVATHASLNDEVATHASLNDEVATQPKITFELYEREQSPADRTRAFMDPYNLRVANFEDYTLKWSSTWQFGTDAAPALNFQLKHFIPDDMLPQGKNPNDTVDLNAWHQGIVTQLASGAEHWCELKGVPPA